jgi:hypothetical protein
MAHFREKEDSHESQIAIFCNITSNDDWHVHEEVNAISWEGFLVIMDDVDAENVEIINSFLQMAIESEISTFESKQEYMANFDLMQENCKNAGFLCFRTDKGWQKHLAYKKCKLKSNFCRLLSTRNQYL